jgi:serine/threonine protein kinase
VKAGNVLLDAQWQPKLTDFGISRLKAGQQGQNAVTSFSGTVAWMAPEMLRGEGSYTEAVDVYAFAMLMFETFTHDVPFANAHMTKITLAVAIKGERPQLWHAVNRTHGAVQDLLVRCWAQDPQERPGAAQVALELGMILTQVPKVIF